MLPARSLFLDTLHPLVEPVLERLFSACVIRVEQRGALVWEHAWGMLGPQLGDQPARVDSVFDLASLTKPFVATAFLRALAHPDLLLHAASLHLSLDSPICTVLPELCDVPQGAVTFRQILSHTSGYPAHARLYQVATDPPGVVRAALALPLEAGPGERIAYSCLGFILLGEMLRRLSGGEELDSLVDRLVLRPLGIQALAETVAQSGSLQAGYRPPVNTWTRIAETEYCDWRGRRLRGEVHDENAYALNGTSGNAGLFGTAAAVCRLASAYLPTKQGASIASLIGADLARQAISVQAEGLDGDRRGLGWQLRGRYISSASLASSLDSFGHTGFTGTCVWADPARGSCVTILTNRVYYGRESTDLLSFRIAINETVANLLDRAVPATATL